MPALFSKPFEQLLWGIRSLAPNVAFDTTTARHNLPRRMSLGSRKQQFNIDIVTDGLGANCFLCWLSLFHAVRNRAYSHWPASVRDCNYGLMT
jgi:hypothetical protein